MSTSVDRRTRAASVEFKRGRMTVSFVDGRALSVPIEWFPRLREASAAQLRAYRLIGRGLGIHWDDLDEDISVEALFQPAPVAARRPPAMKVGRRRAT